MAKATDMETVTVAEQLNQGDKPEVDPACQLDGGTGPQASQTAQHPNAHLGDSVAEQTFSPWSPACSPGSNSHFQEPPHITEDF